MVLVTCQRAESPTWEHLRQLPLKYLEFGNLLLDSAQLLCHELVQAGTHRQTLSAMVVP